MVWKMGCRHRCRRAETDDTGSRKTGWVMLSFRFRFFFLTHLLILHIPPQAQASPCSSTHFFQEVCTCTLMTAKFHSSFIHAFSFSPSTLIHITTRLSGHDICSLPFWDRGVYSWSREILTVSLSRRERPGFNTFSISQYVHKCILQGWGIVSSMPAASSVAQSPCLCSRCLGPVW